MESFFDTFEDAQQYLIKETEERIEKYKIEINFIQKSIKVASEKMEKIKNLKPF